MKNNLLKIKNCFKPRRFGRGSDYTSGLKIGDLRRGMTYVELIVVLGIFGVISSVVMFNYGEFQDKVEIKNLASDIALKVVEAQKSAMSGKLPVNPPSGWKPAYGVYFPSVSVDNKS